MKTRRMIIVSEQVWNTICTALEIEVARNADLDANHDQKSVQQDLQAAISAVKRAVKV